MILSFRASFFIFLTLCSQRSDAFAFLKDIFGAALVGGNLQTAVIASAFTCPNLGNNFTHFKLYTREHPSEGLPLSRDAPSLHNVFNASIPTKIIIHGFLDSAHLSDWMVRMKTALLLEGNYNVIVMDWSCANGFPYLKAVRNAKEAASHLYDLTHLLKAQGANFSDFHLIGHSLGSQIAGLVGHRVDKFGRISALDPAGPMFYEVESRERIDSSDALFVDVIHTDGGDNVLEGLGLSTAIGHIDFYPNGGKAQPGCNSSPLDAFEKFGFRRIARYLLTCDHYRAIDLYIDSIEQEIRMREKGQRCQFIGIKCRDWETFSHGRCVHCSSAENCAVMGFYSNKYSLESEDRSSNVFYLETSDEESYCVYQYGIMMETGTRFASLKTLYNYTRDVITLEILNKDGSRMNLHLNERKEDSLLAGNKYYYIITSKNRIEAIKSASMWQGTESKSKLKVSKGKPKIGVTIKRIEISPIEIHEERKSRSSHLESSDSVVLCARPNDTLTKRQFIKLSPQFC